LAIFAKTVSVA